MLWLFLILVVVQSYWLWLALGIAAAVAAWRSRTSLRTPLWVAALLLVSLGSVTGAVSFGTTSTAEAFEQEASKYFDLACAERARLELPRQLPEAQFGVLLIRDEGDDRSLANGQVAVDLIGPGRGLYQGVQVVGGWPREAEPYVWNTEGALDRPTQMRTTLPEGLLRYGVRSRDATIELDKFFFMVARETVISDEQQGTVIARRYTLTRSGSGLRPGKRSVCPGPEVKSSGCAGNTCSLAPFLLAAVPPALPVQMEKAFHLVRGMGRRTMLCRSDLYVGPGIEASEVVWQQGPGAIVSFAIVGTADVLVCDGFYLNADESLRFRSSGQVFAAQNLRAAAYAASAASAASPPRAVLGTLLLRNPAPS